MRALCVGIALFAFACHDHDHADYASLQACWDVHTNEEHLGFQEALVVCCLDHLGSPDTCGKTAPECVTYVGANLTSTATSTEIETACDEYIVQKNM